MGCDIHPAIFVRTGDGNGRFDWEVVAIPDRCRSYQFFSALAGVRGDPPDGPVAEPRGFPSWVDNIDLEDRLQGDHTASWLSLEEMEAYDQSWMRSPVYDRWLRIMRFYMSEYEVNTSNVVVVFNFDN